MKKPLVMTRRQLSDTIKYATREAVRTAVVCYVHAMIDEDMPDETIQKVYNRMERYVGYIAEDKMTLKDAEKILHEHGIEVRL